MANSEERLEKKFGRENPFTVPEGYFAQLQKNVMDSLPEQETKVIKMAPRRRYLLPVISAAASVCVAICGITIWFNKTTSVADNNYVLSENEVYSHATGDNAEDYIMMDNESIYAYMSQY